MRSLLRVVDTARRVAAKVPILMRTRYLTERDRLLAVGASDVVAEEVESAIEVIARMLRSLELPRNVIDERIEAVRAETQSTERRQTVPRAMLRDVRGLDELKIESAVIREGSPAAGRSAVSLRLRSETGALVVGVRRGEQLMERPDPNVPFEPGDVVYFVGTSGAVRRAIEQFNPRAPVSPGEDPRP